MNVAVFFLIAAAAAFGLVAHITGSWGAAAWAMVLSPVSGLAAAYDVHAARSAGGSKS